MNINDIFYQCHAAISFDRIKPINKKILKELAKKLETSADFLFKIKDYSYSPYIWIYNGCMIELMDASDKALEAMRVKERIQQFINDFDSRNDYMSKFHLMDKRMIIPMLVKLIDEIPKIELYDIFVHVYMRSEFGFEMLKPIMEKIIDSSRYSFERERRIESLVEIIENPKEITVYHGYNDGEFNPNDEMSWTLNYETAEFFANRFDENGKIAEKKITIYDVLDYLDGRGEAEILYIESTIKHIENV